MTKKMIVIEWKERQKKFVDKLGLEVIVQNVGIPKKYETWARASNPLNYQIEDFVRRAARGTNADAYRRTAIKTRDDEYRSAYIVTIELYRILKRVN